MAQTRGPGADGPDGTTPQERLRRLGSQWTSAAEHAFAGMAQSPERYVAAGRLVATWLERLRALPPGPAAVPEPGSAESLQERDDETAATALLAAWDARESRAADDGAALPVSSAQRDALTAAAFAIRYAEVAEWLTLRRRRRAMAGAAADREGWVVLDEAGDADGDPFITYRRLEVDRSTGRGVLVETRPDDGFSRVIHEVHLVSIDLNTGELKNDLSGSTWEFISAKEREDHVAALRSRTARTDGPCPG